MIVIVISLVCFIFYHRYRINRKRLHQELLIAELQQNITLMQQRLYQQSHNIDIESNNQNTTTIETNASNNRFNEVYRRYLDAFDKITKLNSYVSEDGQNLNIIKNMITSLTNDKKLSSEFINEVHFYVNAHYDNILDRIRLLHPNLNDDDLNLMALMIAGYTTSMIVICMGYSDRASLNNKRSRLKKRLGINVTVSTYLQQLIDSTTIK